MPTVQVTTPLGVVDVHIHNQSSITLSVESEHPVIINRVPLSFRIGLERVSVSGHRAEIGTTGWTFSHTGYTVDPGNWRRMGEFPSESARLKIKNIIIPAVLAVLDESPDLFDDAERERLERELSRAQSKVMSHQLDLAQAEDELRQAEIALSNHSQVTA